LRKSVIAGNWKMHMTCAEAKSYLEKFIPLIKNIKDDRKVVIAPPFTAISTFSDHSDFDYIDISSQNIHWEDQGAFTAEISPKMLLEHGVSYAIVGHSEPRKYFSESDEQINKRAVFAQSSGLTPIVCVGETLDQRERGEAVRVITRQVEQGLENTDPSNLIVAYEPIWAIGTGKTCEAEDANKICSLIRNLIGFDMRTDGRRGSFLNLPTTNHEDSIVDEIDFLSGGFSPIQMNGQEVYKFAVKEVPLILEKLFKKMNYTSNEVDWLVLHQANQRILDSVGDRLKIPGEKILSNLEKYGNTSAATIPLVMDEAIRNNRIKQNDIIATSGFGAGLSWGAALIKWG